MTAVPFSSVRGLSVRYGQEAALKSVTRADIQAAAQRYLSEPKALRLAVGPAA